MGVWAKEEMKYEKWANILLPTISLRIALKA